MVKISLSSTIEIVHRDTNCVLWFKGNVNLLGCEALWEIVYIPPENYIYSSVSLFDDIENDTANLRNDSNSPLYLVGDCNARTGNLCDFIESDDQNKVLNDLDEDTIQQLVGRNNLDNVGIPLDRKSLDKKTNNLDNVGIPLDRKSLDKKTNNYGHRLISLCKSLNVHITNGRIGVDRDRGATTCMNASIVDYILDSPQSFYDIMKFEVLECYDFNESGAHNPVKMGFKYSIQNPIVSTIREDELVECDGTALFNKPKWVKDCESSFKNNFNSKDVEDIENDLDNLLCNDIDAASVNDIVICIN